MTNPSPEQEDWLVRFTDWTPDDDFRPYLADRTVEN